MKKYINDYVEVRIRIKQKDYQAIQIMATNNGESIVNLIRRILSNNISQEIISDNINTISNILRRVIHDITRAENDRLAKLIIKTMKASAVSMYQGTQIIEDIGHNKGQDIFDDSLKMAIAYIKTPFDSNDVPLPSLKDESESETYTFTDDDLFEA